MVPHGPALAASVGVSEGRRRRPSILHNLRNVGDGPCPPYLYLSPRRPRCPKPSAVLRRRPRRISTTSSTSHCLRDRLVLFRAFPGEAERRVLSMGCGTKRVCSPCVLSIAGIILLMTTQEFINAQYRFIMKPSGDYTVHFAYPDMYAHLPPDRTYIFHTIIL